jgi:hypothetical protein
LYLYVRAEVVAGLAELVDFPEGSARRFYALFEFEAPAVGVG